MSSAVARLTRHVMISRQRARLRPYVEREQRKQQADPLDLRNFEFQEYSQQGEDGIVREIFRRIGAHDRHFLEFGVEDGTECNTRRLVEAEGWWGTWIDGNPEQCARAAHAFPGVNVVNAFLRLDNITEVVQSAAVPVGLDLLVIDVDGNDFWFALALRFLHPRVLIVEYNAAFPPPSRWVMPYNARKTFDFSNQYGASLGALDLLTRDMGYTLVGCDSRGVNAFFVRNEELQGRFSHAGQGAAYHYVAPKYNPLAFGWWSTRMLKIARLKYFQ
jgi:hypothetical protein